MAEASTSLESAAGIRHPHLEAFESGSKSCPTLPTELWALVFTHTDDFTLWVGCRQVSRVFRVEAEREFCQARLPRLRINWDSSTAIDDSYSRLIGSYTGMASLNCFIAVDESGHRARFRAKFSHEIKTIQSRDAHWGRGPGDDEGCQRAFRRGFCFSDLDFENRVQHEHRDSQVVELAPIVTTVEIPDFGVVCNANVAEGEISFGWRSFSNRFFAEEAFVRRLRKERYRSARTGHGSADTWERALQDISTKLLKWNKINVRHLYDGMNSFGMEECELGMYEEAIIQRLQRAHTRAGLIPDLDGNTTVSGETTNISEQLRELVVRQLDRRNVRLWRFDGSPFNDLHNWEPTPDDK